MNLYSPVLVFCLAFSCTAAYADDTVYVQVRNSKVRSAPNAWSSQVASLSYGDSVTKIGGEDPWWKVKTAQGQVGYISTASVTTRKVVLNSHGSAGHGGVDQSDVVLAGKGFSKEAESSFAATSHASFAEVDAMERIKISEGEAREFLKAGQLGGGK